MKGILGKKLGMTQVFATDGKLVPVTVVEVEPNVVTQVKTVSSDGYDAVQLGFDTIREKISNKPRTGHTNKANTAPKRFLREIRGVDVSKYELGQIISADLFEAGEMVDVSGISKGKGFQGVIKRHNQSRGPMSHGSQYHRGVGSMGTLLPMHVLKGKKLPGHMGNVTTTVQNLEIIAVDMENNCLLVKGNVPGPKNALVMIKTAIKNQDKINTPIELISYEVEEETIEETTNEAEVSEEVVEETNVEAETTEEVSE